MKEEMYFAKVEWAVADIKSIKPRWSKNRCMDFLLNNEHHIQDRLTEHGWEVIADLIQYEEWDEKQRKKEGQ